MLLPSRRAVWISAGLLGLGIPASILGLQAFWYPVAALFAIGLLADAMLLRRVPTPEVARRIPPALALGVRSGIVLRVTNSSDAPLRAELHDAYPPDFEAEGMPREVVLAPRAWAELVYEVRALSRGAKRFGSAQLRVYGPLGLLQATRFSGPEQAVRVYPNFRALAKYTLLATDNRLSQIGVLQVRRRGEGMEFHQLREYREGDPHRAIDWKATARTARLISREYEDEKDQRVMLVVDCGRRMAAKDDAGEDALSHFDHTLNAALLLSHVAVRQGDAVGMLTMGGVRRYCEPRKSVAAVHALLNRAYDIEPTLAVPDYQDAARELMRHVRRRSLVILLTNLRDEDDETLLPALQTLRARHLVVLASLREAILGRALGARVDTFDRAVTHAAAAEYLALRERAFRRIAAAGVVTLDVEPDRLAIALVNRYLELKRAGRL
jgi:uncharacterized protein (DUF58 family)